MANPGTGLKRQLSLFSVLALAAGAVLGGWLAEAPYWFQLTGAGAAIIFPILAVLLVPVGMAFSELTSVLPYASAVPGGMKYYREQVDSSYASAVLSPDDI